MLLPAKIFGEMHSASTGTLNEYFGNRSRKAVIV